jgi:hypothetical protein
MGSGNIHWGAEKADNGVGFDFLEQYNKYEYVMNFSITSYE